MWGDHYKAPGADLLDGGPGTDVTQEWSIPDQLDRQPAVNVTLDGQATTAGPARATTSSGSSTSTCTSSGASPAPTAPRGSSS
jgi:hypothetical protein